MEDKMSDISTTNEITTKKPKPSAWSLIKKDFKKHKLVFFLLIPIILYYTIFEYGPMAGIIIAFKNYRPARGIFNSSWVGLTHFKSFFGSYYFWDLIRNTFKISISNIVFGFPAPIILALFLNEVRCTKFKKTVQTITYMPHFISTVVMAGIVVDMVSTNGVVNRMLQFFGVNLGNLLHIGPLFVPIYVISNIWQSIGWGTIIYLSALSSVGPELYEVADLDGAGRFKKMWYVTLPGIMPTIVTLLIMRLGKVMAVGYEHIILLSNPVITQYSQVISSFVYQSGIEKGNYSYASAVGLFNSVINFTLLLVANKISKKVNNMSLW